MKLLLGDCVEQMRTLPENSVDSIVTDPPYELGFMGKSWDASGIAYSVEMWREALRVLKPAGNLLAFGGTRTYHRMVCAIEDAGFEIRDQLQWLYGSGFPKSYNISKGIDKKRVGDKFFELREYLKKCIDESGLTQVEIKKYLGYPENSGVIGHWVGNSQQTTPSGKDWDKMKKILPIDDRYDEFILEVEREVIGKGKAGFLEKNNVFELNDVGYGDYDLTTGTHDLAKKWNGWGSGLKPANEPICLARKPLSEKNLVDNCLKWGVGGLNIDDSRIGVDVVSVHNAPSGTFAGGEQDRGSDTSCYRNHVGRFPSNVLLDEESAKLLDKQSGIRSAGAYPKKTKGKNLLNSFGIYGKYNPIEINERINTGVGGASRFFYVAKASKSERNRGLDGFEEKRRSAIISQNFENALTGSGNKRNPFNKNHHPTIKPIKLMEYLVKLVTPKNAVVLDMFMGSGTTGIACKNLGFDFIGIEKEPEYFEIAKARIGFQTKVL